MSADFESIHDIPVEGNGSPKRRDRPEQLTAEELRTFVRKLLRLAAVVFWLTVVLLPIISLYLAVVVGCWRYILGG